MRQLFLTLKVCVRGEIVKHSKMLGRWTLIGIIIVLVAVSGCANEPERVVISSSKNIVFEQDTNSAVYAQAVSLGSHSPEEKDMDTRIRSIKLNAVGDIMVHRTQLIKADRGGEFDFSPSFEHISPVINTADYSLANLETTFAGALGQRRFNVDRFYKGYSGFPTFNTPDEMATVIKEAGIDLLSTANNHTFDSKVPGILRTLDILDEVGIEHTGSFATEEAAEQLTVFSVEGVSFGVINYTYGMNGFTLEEDEQYLVNTLDMYASDKLDEMYQKVKAAESEVDFVIVMLHYGNEYVIHPDRYYQKPIVDDLFKAGADVIFGGHPHVLQPYEVRQIQRQNGRVETGVVIYSLGNFISSQRSLTTNGDDTDIGGVFEVTFSQVDHHTPFISEIAFTPTFVHWSVDGLRVIPTLDLPDELTYTSYDRQQINRANTYIAEHMQSYMTEPMTFDGLYYRHSIDSFED